MNPSIVRDIAARISETSLENLAERKDKFVSNVYKARIEARILGKEDDGEKRKHVGVKVMNATGQVSTKTNPATAPQLFWCTACHRLLTYSQSKVISCC